MVAKTSKQFQCPTHWTLTQRLDHYTDKSGGPDACWPWTGARTELGYGRLFWKGRLQGVHRLAWVEKNGPIPAGMKACHKCDNPPCRNEAHLFLGTDADNAADRERKGRGNQARGERQAFAKLTEADVRAIRGAEGTYRAIAEQFGIDQTNVGRIRRGRAWAHVL